MLFTLFAQAAYGMFLIPFLGSLFGIEAFETFVASDMFLPLAILAVVFTSFALLMSVTHLGKPLRFYRGFNNLRYSPMSREGFGLAMFSAGAGLTALFAIPSNTFVNELSVAWLGLDLAELTSGLPLASFVTGAGVFAIIAGFGGLYYMNKCYQIKARPFWNHLQTATSFAGNSLSLGALFSAVVVLSTLWAMGAAEQSIVQASCVFGLTFVVGMVIEALGLIKHNHDLNRNENEGGAAHYVQCTTFGKTYLFRNWLLGLNIVAAASLVGLHLLGFNDISLVFIGLALGLINFFTAAIGRALFYILVIPTTMPGAFSGRTKALNNTLETSV